MNKKIIKTWETAEGEEIPYNKLKDDHLRNILRWIKRKSEIGITIQYGGGGWDIDDMWYYEDELKGKEVLEHYDHKGLLKEAVRRKLIKEIRI